MNKFQDLGRCSELYAEQMKIRVHGKKGENDNGQRFRVTKEVHQIKFFTQTVLELKNTDEIAQMKHRKHYI